MMKIRLWKWKKLNWKAGIFLCTFPGLSKTLTAPVLYELETIWSYVSQFWNLSQIFQSWVSEISSNFPVWLLPDPKNLLLIKSETELKCVWYHSFWMRLLPRVDCMLVISVWVPFDKFSAQMKIQNPGHTRRVPLLYIIPVAFFLVEQKWVEL